MPACRGFTLLELVVVVLIIAVAAGIVLPSVRAGARQREVRRTLQHFVSAVRRASSVAVLRRKPVELRVWPEAGRYEIVVRDRSTEGDDLEEDGRRRRRRLREEPEDQEKPEASFELAELASFGEIEGGRYLPETHSGGRYRTEEVIVFDFLPTGASSGGRIEFLFDVARREQTYTVVIDPLVSSISMEGDA